MNNITLAQREALDVVKDMIDGSGRVPEFGTKIMTLIIGILNIDCRVEHTAIDITDITDNGGGKGLPINPDDGNGKINLDIPDWIKNVPTPPFSPLIHLIRDRFGIIRNQTEPLKSIHSMHMDMRRGDM